MENLVFIYKARSSVLANLPGAVAKMFGGKSVCSLCNITHGPVQEKPVWEKFLSSLSEEPEVYHADEIPSDIQAFLDARKQDLPVVFKRKGATFDVVATHRDIERCDGDPTCLIRFIEEARKNGR